MHMIKSMILAGSLLFSGAYAVAQGLPVPTALSSNSGSLVSRSPDSRGWTDPALNHNKLLQQQSGDGVYKLIGPYKVIGSSYLFGERHKADMYATDAKALNIYISYNTFNQEVEFYSSSNPDKPLVREPGTVDSFMIQPNSGLGISGLLKFIYGPLLGSKDKYYFQEVCKGDQVSLYKRYKSDLGYSSANLAQSELRQFDLEFEYYYSDTESKTMKKIKPNAASVIKEFKNRKDLSADISNEDFTSNPETAFCKAIGLINGAKKGF
jgi:hypothetical protein